MSDGPHDDHQHRRPHTPPMAASFLEFDLVRESGATSRRTQLEPRTERQDARQV